MVFSESSMMLLEWKGWCSVARSEKSRMEELPDLELCGKVWLGGLRDAASV